MTRRIDSGDRLDSWYRDYGPVVLRRARGILGREEDAEDVLQDIFAKLSTRPSLLSGPGPHTGWFYRVTTNACLTRLRQRRLRGKVLESVMPPDAATESTRIEQMLLLRQLLPRLPQRLAAIAVYYYADCMSHDEISAVTGWPRRTIGRELERFRARAEKLRSEP